MAGSTSPGHCPELRSSRLLPVRRARLLRVPGVRHGRFRAPLFAATVMLVATFFGSPASPAGDPQRLESAHQRIAAKLRGLQERIDRWLADGGDPHEVLPLGQRLDRLMDSGTPEEIEAQIDRIRAVVAKPPPPQRRNPGTSAGQPLAIDVRPIPRDAAIVFYSTRSGVGQEIYTMNDDGGGVTQITKINPRSRDQPYEHVAVSFDHKLIAVDRYLQSGSGPTGLWVLDLHDKTERRLLPDFFVAGSGGVDWSADGYIYFAARPSVNAKAGVFRVRPDGSGLAELIALDAADPGYVGDVSVSADSSMLAYVRAIGVESNGRERLKTQIWVSKIDGSQARMVDDGGPEIGSQGGFPIGDFDPELSPDNLFVVFSRTNTHSLNFKDSFDTAHDLWIAALDGSSPARRLTRAGPISIVPDWEDSEILYTEYNEAHRFAGLVLIHPDGSGYRRLEPKLDTFRNCGRHGKWIPNSAAQRQSPR